MYGGRFINSENYNKCMGFLLFGHLIGLKVPFVMFGLVSNGNAVFLQNYV
jgi:hypothetical protein